MELAEVRRLVVIAMFSDDILFNQLVLKGGNALNLVYGIGMRSSLDVDLSLSSDFEDFEEAKRRIFKALSDRFAEVGLTVFAEKFNRRPTVSKDDKWGGYEAEFKLMETIKYNSMRDDGTRAQREALAAGPNDERIFRVQISKHEYCDGKVEHNLDEYSIYVYTPEMIAIEKLRAICQQMDAYPMRRYSTPRARDFYDIFATIERTKIDLSSASNQELVRNIFAAKSVPLRLLSNVDKYREFHRQDWPSVELTVAGKLLTYDFYFDFVLSQIELLKPLWIE